MEETLTIKVFAKMPQPKGRNSEDINMSRRVMGISFITTVGFVCFIAIFYACLCNILPYQLQKALCMAGLCRFTTVQVTFVDTKQNPIRGATFTVSDVAQHELYDKSLMFTCSGYSGQASHDVLTSSTYFIHGYATGYFPNKIQITSASKKIKVVLVLKQKPLPPYPVTTIQVKVVDVKGIPIEGAKLLIVNRLGNVTDDLARSSFLDTDRNGKTEKTIAVNGVYTIQAYASDYSPSQSVISSKPGTIPVTFVLKRANQEIAQKVQQTYVREMQKKLENGLLPIGR